MNQIQQSMNHLFNPINAYVRPKVAIAKTIEERNQIYRLRYQTYLDQLKEDRMAFNYNYDLVQDGYDASAIHLGAFIHGQAIGACRLNFVDSHFSDEYDLYELDRFENIDRRNLVVISKFLIEKAYRSTGLFSIFLYHLYALALMQESKIALACIPISMTSWFSKYGFISYRGMTLHPELGQVFPMYLDLQNERFMSDISSPFLVMYEAFKEGSESPVFN